MLVRVGDISPGGALRLTTEVKCAGCGAKHKYLVLLDQIGDEAMRRADRAIDGLKQHPSRPTPKG